MGESDGESHEIVGRIARRRPHVGGLGAGLGSAGRSAESGRLRRAADVLQRSCGWVRVCAGDRVAGRAVQLQQPDPRGLLPETCPRSASASDLFTSKQAKAFISNASPLLLNFNGLAAIASTVQGNDLVPLNFPIHARTHWIDIRTGRVRALEPIILDSFLTLDPLVRPLVEPEPSAPSVCVTGVAESSTRSGPATAPVGAGCVARRRS